MHSTKLMRKEYFKSIHQMQFLLINQFIISLNLLTMVFVFCYISMFCFLLLLLFYFPVKRFNEIFYLTFQINYRTSVVAGAATAAEFRFCDRHNRENFNRFGFVGSSWLSMLVFFFFLLALI